MDIIKQSTPILLKDVLYFDKLRKKYPEKRIKLRFNTSWTDKQTGAYFDFLTMYENEETTFFNDCVLSQGAKTRRISTKDIVFQFIETSPHKWLFIDAVNVTNDFDHKGFNKTTKRDFDVAEAERLHEYEPFFGRLTVRWKNKPQQFYYIDQNLVDSVEVQEISEHAYLDRDNSFAGYENVCKTFVELRRILGRKDWIEALSGVYGVYVITDNKTGKAYIGSAYGDNGIYGRWLVYINSGYDKDEKETGEYPNKKLKDLVQREGMAYITENFQYTILEIFPKNEIGKDRALQRESYWKKVFHTRMYGYNDN